jgi:integrase
MHLLESSGLRISDALMLHTKLVDGGRLFLRQQEKTGTPVCVPLPPHVIERLQSLPLFNNTHYFWDGRSRIESARGKYSKFFLRLCKRAQVVKGHFHRFRDTFAVALLTEGVTIEHVSKLLGHRSTKITEEHY